MTELDKNIKDLETWAEAEKWLSRHGFGLEQIRIQKEFWDKTAKPKVAAVSPAPAAPSKTK